MGGVIFSINGRLEYLELRRLIENGNREESDVIGSDGKELDCKDPDGKGPSGREADPREADGKEGDGNGSGEKGPKDHGPKLYAAARKALESLPARDMEISDRSKGDAITKGLTLLQTTWFIVQLAARKVQRLNVTALEILTLAYAVMNLFVYIFWWNKPFNVQSPIVFYLTIEREAIGPSSQSDEAKDQPVSQASPSLIPDEIPGSLFAFPFNNSDTDDSAIAAHGPGDLIRYPPMSLTIVTRRMNSISWPILLVVLCLSGAIYYIAWDLTFPSPVGRTLWRVFCSLITVAPFASMVVFFTLMLITAFLLLILSCICCSSKLFKKVLENKEFGRVMGIIVFVVFYSVCRLVLISLALWSLHDLPLDAHETVIWSRYIPHV
jgi:hypothetical protein